MKAITCFFCILVITSFFSCKKEVKNINLPSIASKPVALCFLSPNEKNIQLSLTPSYPLNSNVSLPLVISDAKVRIVNNGDSVLLEYNPNTYLYTCDTLNFKIRKGQIYQLLITLNDNEEITSQCQIPAIQMPQFSEQITNFENSGFDYNAIINNSAHIDAYLILQFLYPHISQFTGDTLYSEIDFITSELHKDQNILGLGGHITIPDYFYFQYPGVPNLPCIAKLLMCDVQTYKFHKNLPKKTFGDNQFNTIPSYYSFNINGGLGVFGSYIEK